MSMILSALLLTTPAIAAAPQGVPAAGEDSAAKPKPKKICHSFTRSGSRIAETVCRTQAEWDSQPSLQDMGEGVDIPGNRAATGREINRGGINRATPAR